MDSAYVSQELRERLHQLGCIDIIIAGKGNDVFTIDAQKWDASTWKKVLMLEEPTWGIDVPSCRIWGYSPTCGSLILFFFRKSTTRSARFAHFYRVLRICNALYFLPLYHFSHLYIVWKDLY